MFGGVGCVAQFWDMLADNWDLSAEGGINE